MSYSSVPAARERMRSVINQFVSNERGAATIDWVALTAGVLLIGVAMVYSIFNNGVGDTASSISSSLEAAGANVDTGVAPNQGDFGNSSGVSTEPIGGAPGGNTDFQSEPEG